MNTADIQLLFDFSSSGLLLVLVYFAKRFINTIEKMEDVQTQILARLAAKHEKIEALQHSEVRQDGEIRDLQQVIWTRKP